MKAILIINGIDRLATKLSRDPIIGTQCEVIHMKIQSTKWFADANGQLVVFDKSTLETCHEPDLVIWRVGAIKPTKIQEHALNMIAFTNTTCINSVESLKKGHDRLSMLNGLIRSSLPVINFEVFSSTTAAKTALHRRQKPYVIKVGNHHGGDGKIRVTSSMEEDEAISMLNIIDDYFTIEPFIDYDMDVRYMIVGSYEEAMARKGLGWKANTRTIGISKITPDKDIMDGVRQLKDKLGLDMIAVDLLVKDGQHVAIEYNDIPGLVGWPKAEEALLDLVKERLGL